MQISWDITLLSLQQDYKQEGFVLVTASGSCNVDMGRNFFTQHMFALKAMSFDSFASSVTLHSHRVEQESMFLD